MADTHVMSALKDKRARLDGEIKMRRYQIARLEMEMAHVDAVIRMFSPGYDVSTIATKRSIERSKTGTVRGSGVREALTVLRETGEWLTANELAHRVWAKRKQPRDEAGCSQLACNIQASFSRRKGGVLRHDASIYPGKWKVGRDGPPHAILEGE